MKEVSPCSEADFAVAKEWVSNGPSKYKLFNTEVVV